MIDLQTASAIIAKIARRQSTELPDGDDMLSAAIRDVARVMEEDSRRLLDRTVRFSMNSSEAMTAVAQMSANLQDTDTRTQVMAAAVEKMTTSIADISSAGSAATELAKGATHSARHGAKMMDTVVGRMERINEVVEGVSRRTDALSAASRQIAGILETINTVAKQTNLLALNATIESARAGEHGKGFAVVAGEVKSLSNQTARATEDIQKKIDLLTSEISGLLQAVGLVLTEVAAGKSTVHEASESIASVSGDVSNVMLRMEDVSNMLLEQTVAVQEIGQGVAQVAELSAQNRLRTDITIKAVSAAESLVDEQFAELEKAGIRDYVLYRAKSDHFIWKKKLAEGFVGLATLKAEELADHHQCRLGKWYDKITDPSFTQDADFNALVEPHARVHKLGKEAARAHVNGDLPGSERLFNQMEAASLDVVSLLDRLLTRRAAAA